MNRREFSKGLGLSAGLGLASTAINAADPKEIGGSDWAAAFDAAMQEQPWLLAYRSVDQSAFNAQAKLVGKWPSELRGTLYRNGPARHEVHGFRYQHWFDGDGMMQAYRIGPDSVTHQARLVATHKVIAEDQAGRALYPGFASIPPNPAPVTSPDVINVANISVLPHHNKLMALWEAGSPWEIDPDTLETKGIYAFSEHTKGVPFSAHPRVEADGTLWNFGYLSSAGMLVFWHISPTGKLVKVGKIDVDPITMVHDFVVTQNHIVLLIPPLDYQIPTRAMSFLDAHTWRPDNPTRVLVVDKNDFSNHFFVELPAQWVFHFGNGWEDKNGVIRFDAARADDPMAMISSFREIMRGNIVPSSPSHHHQYRIDTKRRTISEIPLFHTRLDTEFPCVDPRVSCRKNSKITFLASHADQPAPHGLLNEVSSFDFESGQRDHFRYPDHIIPEEHLFIPAPDSAVETQGWVLGSGLDWKAKVQKLFVFDAQHLQDGPLAEAHLPYSLPLGLHGKFQAA
ncbi:MAG: carotenoid oxygenase family protein [Pseudomonadota bacterium]